jgi:hypothetical protein
MSYELSKYKPEPSSLKMGSDITEQNMTAVERDDETLARLGKKPVLKVWFAKDSAASSCEAFPMLLQL